MARNRSRNNGFFKELNKESVEKMNRLGALGVGIVVTFIAFILCVILEILYVGLKKKRQRIRERRVMLMMNKDELIIEAVVKQ